MDGGTMKGREDFDIDPLGGQDEVETGRARSEQDQRLHWSIDTEAGRYNLHYSALGL